MNTTCSTEACHLSLAARADTTHYLTITNVASLQLPVSLEYYFRSQYYCFRFQVSLAVSITLTGCRDQSFTEGAMMVNSINTALLCGETNR